ncbi:MAG: hypothetical protein NXI12_11400 [Alphaproteobacteria bacterium]|nr:hypothetical protein [Alphaproteobacteria bacterium]
MQLGKPIYGKNIEGLSVIQTVYAFIMALGLGEIFIAFPVIFERIALYETRVLTLQFLVIGLLLLAIILLGIRFFWVPRNLRQLTVVVSKCAGLAAEGGPTPPEVSIRNIFFPVHILVILIHAALFYHACVELKRLIYLYAAQDFLSLRDLNAVVVTIAVLLLVNAAWLIFVERQIDAAYDSTGRPAPAGARPGSIWWKNNLLAAIAALTFHTAFVTCGAAASQCLAANSAFASRFPEIIPATPDEGGLLLQGALFGLEAQAAELAVALIIMAILLLNSLVDLWRTGASYLIFDEIEWWADPEAGPLERADRDETTP